MVRLVSQTNVAKYGHISHVHNPCHQLDDLCGCGELWPSVPGHGYSTDQNVQYGLSDTPTLQETSLRSHVPQCQHARREASVTYTHAQQTYQRGP